MLLTTELVHGFARFLLRLGRHAARLTLHALRLLDSPGAANPGYNRALLHISSPCRAVAAVCVTLYLFDVLTGWVDIASVCLSAHLLIDKLQVYRCRLKPLALLCSIHVG